MDILGVSSFLRTGLTVLVYASPNPSLYNATEQNLWANRYIHIYVRVCAQSLSCVQLFVTPWTVAYQAPLSMELSRQEYWSGLPFPTPGNLPRDRTHVSCISCIVRWILYYCTTWEAIYTYAYIHTLFHILFHSILLHMLNTVDCAIQQDLVVHPFCIEVMFANPNLLQHLSPNPLLIGNQKFVLYVCGTIPLLSFVSYFKFHV